ncbi:MAG: RDD family protein [Acidimicrobiales bacterium]
MADQSEGEGWWQASDGKWYAPYVHPDNQPPPADDALPLPPGVSEVSPWARLGAWFFEGLLVIFTLVIGWIIWAAFTGNSGQTPAKKLLNQRVIRADTMQPCNIGKMFWVRGVLGILVWIVVQVTFYILALWPFWDKNKQNLWDKMSNTYVVNDPNDAWHTQTPKPGGDPLGGD